jgi:phosphoglycerol transferase MdoB-like AlkP superfamily enzyme
MSTLSQMMSQDPLWEILIRFLVTLIVLFIVIRGIYYRYTKKEEFMFSFFLMGVMVFTICSLLKTVDIKVGMGVGLFAIFSILRFRTRNLQVKAMSYFFTVIGISAVNALANFPRPVRGTILVNAIIMLTVFLLELYFNKKNLTKHTLIYDKLELLDPQLNEELLKDVSARIRKQIVRVEIEKIDLIKGNAELEVFYRDTKK